MQWILRTIIVIAVIMFFMVPSIFAADFDDFGLDEWDFLEEDFYDDDLYGDDFYGNDDFWDDSLFDLINEVDEEVWENTDNIEDSQEVIPVEDDIFELLDLWDDEIWEPVDSEAQKEDSNTSQEDETAWYKYGSCSVIDDILYWYDSTTYSTKFLDTKESLYREDITRIEKAWVINWRSVNTFDPYEPLTRAEFLAVALKAHCIDVSTPAIHPFTDVEGTWWKSRVIGKAVSEWIISWEINASGQRIFRPNDSITRMEVVAILLKLSKEDIPRDRQSPYMDIASQQWQKNYVTKWNELWLFMPEKTHNLFYPNRFINREHIGTVLYRLAELYR